MSEQPNITAALTEWRAAIGDAAVHSDDATRGQYARTTLITGHAPGAVVYPSDTAQVQAIVRIAAKHRVPLYPISKGRNLGYGDRTAPTPGQVIVDLGRMNRIIEVNEQLAYAVIEPGVTQGRLYQHLKAKHPGLWMDATGAGLEASIIGNTVDRGFGHNFDAGADWDRAFIDRVHARDESAIRRGEIKPTHLMAMLCVGRKGEDIRLDGLDPSACIRRP